MHDITELQEHSSKNIAAKKEKDGLDSTEEVINKLKHGCGAKNPLRSYTKALSTFLTYIFKFDSYLMHKRQIKSIKTFACDIEDEKKNYESNENNYIGIVEEGR